MASTFSPNLRLELITTGEQQGTWGATTNTNLGTLLEQAIGGYTSVTVSDGGDTTLTTVNGGSDQSRNMTLNLTGTLTAARNVIVPAIQKVYIVKNATTGGFSVTLKVSGQTGVSVANGATAILYVDGTDVRSATGTIATQNSSNVSITGGNITGLTNLAASNVSITGGNATGLTNLAASNVSITGGVVSNLTSLSANTVSITGGDLIGLDDFSAANVSVLGGNLIFGSGDATANVTAPTIRGAARAGTNLAGVNLVIDAANGTGTGGSGSIVIRTAAAGTSGTTENTLRDVLTIDKDGNITANVGTFYGSGGSPIGGNVAGINSQSNTSYTFVLADAGKLVEMSNSSANTVTVPPNASVAFPVGTVINITSTGTGQTTIVAGSGVSLYSYGNKLKLTGQYSQAAIIKRSTNGWAVAGDLQA